MITTKNIKLDGKSFFKVLIVITLKRKWWIYAIFCMLAIISIFQKKGEAIFDFPVIFAVLYPIINLIQLWIFANSADNKLFLVERFYTIHEDKLVGNLSDGSDSTIMLVHIVKVIQTSQFYLLYIAKNQFIYLPKNAFASDEDKEWFETSILPKITAK